MGCQVLSAHVERVTALLAESAAATQTNLRRALTTLRSMRHEAEASGSSLPQMREDALDLMERALLDCSLYLQEHDVIRQYQAIISSAIEGIAERLDELSGAIPNDAREHPVELPEAILDFLWTRYVSDEQRAVHRQQVPTAVPPEDPPLPKLQLF